MNILVTGANGQLGNEMRIVSKNTSDNYIFTDVNQVEGLETTYPLRRQRQMCIRDRRRCLRNR